MTLPDPIERGEARAEDWYFSNVKHGIATCGCGNEFKLEDGETLSADPYAIPVCSECFNTQFREWQNKMGIYYYEIELEDFQNRFFALVEIEFEIIDGEPMVRYYPDGSGNPGSPAELNVISVIVTSLSNDAWDKNREELLASGWSDMVDKLALDEVNSIVDAQGWLVDHLFHEASI